MDLQQFGHPNANIASWIPLIVLIGLCATAAWLDATQRRLPNWLCALTAVFGLVVAFVLGGLSEVGNHGLHLAAALAGGLALFSVRIIGAGDAKYYAGIASWFALSEAIKLLLFVSLSGVALLIVWFAYRRAKGIPIRSKTNSLSDSLPYGLAIGAGAVLTALV